MPNTTPTIYDVAKEAGVSIATVSRVLNSPAKVNPATRSIILAAIDRLNFVPKAESRARALMSTNRIGVLIPFFTAPSFVQRLRGISSVLSEENYEMVIYPVDSQKRMNDYLETLPLNRNLDGLIIVSQAVDGLLAKRLLECHLETVLIEYDEPNFCTLQIDNIDGGYMATRYLIDKGHRNFVFAGGRDIPKFGVDPIKLRLEGFRRALSEANISVPESAIHMFVTDPKEMLESAITTMGTPLAIVATVDLQALVLMKEARSLGLRLPQDIAIIGFDDIDMAALVGLTTVRQPLDESGKIAAELLLSRLKDHKRSPQHIWLPLKIIERETA